MLITFAYPNRGDASSTRGVIDDLCEALKDSRSRTSLVSSGSEVLSADLFVVFSEQFGQMSHLVDEAIRKGAFVVKMSSGPSSVKRKGKVFEVTYAGYFDAWRCLNKVIWFLEHP